LNAPELVACSGRAAFATDGKGRVLAWNQGAERLLGFPRDWVRRKRCYEVLRGTDLFGNRFCDRGCPLVHMARRQEAVQPFELNLRKASGELVRSAVSAIVLPGPTPGKLTLIHLLEPLEPEPVGQAAGPGPDPSPAPQPDPAQELTPRELEVLWLLCEGRGTREIAGLLAISATTVRNHVEHVLHKLHVHSRLEAVSVARGSHLTETPPQPRRRTCW
jgi:DNA-binding CsgD family transcriptional regulator